MKKMIFYFAMFISVAVALKTEGGATLPGGKNYEFYYKNGSVPRAEKMTDDAVLFGISAAKKTGESCLMTKDAFEKLLAKLCAEEVFRESGEDFDNVYYFSPFISDFVYVSGKKVNIHAAKSGTGKTLKVATPINFGGY